MQARDIAAKYYAAFTNGGDWSGVPMKAGLRFESPMMTIDGADEFRQALAGLSKRVKGLQIRRQLCDSDCVVSIYDFDMGAGPMPMAETLSIANGEIDRVELIFDSNRMKPAA